MTIADAGIHLGGAPATSASSNDLHNHSGPLPRDGNPIKVDNPMPHRLPEGENAAPLEVIGTTASDKLVIIMVGLPATGKTHIAKRICRFLSFFHDIPAQIFNVGDYRRQLFGAKMPANFYDPSNAEGLASRTMACDAALADLIDYIKQDGVRVAAFDATNSTMERRKHIMQRLKDAGLGAKRMFVESICDQEGVSCSSVGYIAFVPSCFSLLRINFCVSYWKKIFVKLSLALPTIVIWIQKKQ